MMTQRLRWFSILSATLALFAGAAIADEPPAPGNPAPADDTTPPDPMAPQPAPTPQEPPADEPAPMKPEGSTASAGDDLFVRFDGQDLKFEQPRFGGESRLFVRSDSGWRVHRGANLDAILASESSLASHAEISALQADVKAQMDRPTTDLRVGGAVRSTIEDRNLAFEPATAGDDARLFVRRDGTELMFVGSDLDAIVRENPDLVQTEGFDAFRARVRQFDPNLIAIRPDTATVLDVRYGPESVSVSSFAFHDGRWDTRTWRGESIAVLAQREPAFRDLVIVSGESPMPTTQPAGRREEVPAPAPGAGGEFGGTLSHPPGCLDSQLGLNGSGVLVDQVLDGSRAAALGLEAHDVIVEIDGRPAGSAEDVRTSLAQATGDRRPSIVVIRGGQRVTLSR
jgi:hypothetical protein